MPPKQQLEVAPVVPVKPNKTKYIVLASIFIVAIGAVSATGVLYRAQIFNLLFPSQSEPDFVSGVKDSLETELGKVGFDSNSSAPELEGLTFSQIFDLSFFATALIEYEEEHGVYPASLEDLPSISPLGEYPLTDPVSNRPYKYTVQNGGADYSLCALTPAGDYCIDRHWMLDSEIIGIIGVEVENEFSTASGVKIIPQKVIEDNCAPESVKCVQIGALRVLTTVEVASSSPQEQIFEIGRPIVFETREVKLVYVNRLPLDHLPEDAILPENYRFIFKVRILK